MELLNSTNILIDLKQIKSFKTTLTFTNASGEELVGGVNDVDEVSLH